MQRALEALQEALALDEHGVQEFLTRLEQEDAAIAGSFPLLFCCQPKLHDWHPKTRQEVLILAWISKQYGFSLPRLALEQIGNLLQLAPFQADWEAGRVDIDIFQMRAASRSDQPFGLTGWTAVPI